MRKLKVKSIAGLVRYAIRNRLTLANPFIAPCAVAVTVVRPCPILPGATARSRGGVQAVAPDYSSSDTCPICHAPASARMNDTARSRCSPPALTAAPRH